MNKSSINVISFASRVIKILAVIQGIAVLLLLLLGQVITALLQVGLLALQLWVFFRLLYSYESIITEVMQHDIKINELQETVKHLAEELRGDTPCTVSAALEKMSRKLKPIEHRIKPEAEYPLKKGFVQCPNPYCREIQIDNREVCWKCGTKLVE